MWDTSLLLRVMPALGSGLAVTLAITLAAFILATGLGLVLAACSRSNVAAVRRGAGAFSVFTRSVPELIAIFWVYYCFPVLFDLRISGVVGGTLALGLIGSGYMGEVIRAGIAAVPDGQWQAARALALPRFILWRDIVLPQATRKMLPAILNQFTDMLKNSTLLAGVGVAEIAYAAYLAGSATYRYLEPLTGVALLFFIVIFPLSMIARRLSARDSIVTNSL